MHFFNSLCLELLALKLISWLCSLLQYFDRNSFILEVILFNFLPIDLSIFIVFILLYWNMYNSKLRVIAYLFHLPVDEALIII